MSIVSIESSIDRAKKLVRSKVRSVMEECKNRRLSMEFHSDSIYRARRSGIGEVLQMARKTVSSLRPRNWAVAPIRDDPAKSSSRSLGDLFFTLPVELQLEVVNRLFFFDLLSLRRTSRKFRELTTQNENQIVRHHIGQWAPSHITKLYPPPIDIPPTLGYLTDLAYKQRVSTHLALSLARQIVKEMMGGRQSRKMSKEDTACVLDQLRLGMAPLVFALFHFLETYRTRKLERLVECEYNNDEPSMVILNPLSPEKNMELQSDIISQYPDNMLLQVHQMYHLLLHLFMRRMSSTPISVHRTLGRWTQQRPSNQAFAKVLILGGIKEVWHIYRIKGYCRRRRALEKYLRKLDSERTCRSRRHSGFEAGASNTRSKGFPLTLNIPAFPPNHTNNPAPPPPPISKLAQLDVDDLVEVWTPAAEERLLSREIVESLDEVRCCGQFVSQFLGSTAESDDSEGEEEEDDDEDGEDSEDEDDSADHSPTLSPGNTHYPYTVLTTDSFWTEELVEVEPVGLSLGGGGLGVGSLPVTFSNSSLNSAE